MYGVPNLLRLFLVGSSVEKVEEKKGERETIGTVM